MPTTNPDGSVTRDPKRQPRPGASTAPINRSPLAKTGGGGDNLAQRTRPLPGRTPAQNPSKQG
jgi:hypothetical protein